MRQFQWGILGTGAIARQFVDGLNSLPGAEVLSVGSRSEASAVTFAGERGIPRSYAGYADLAADSDLDVVYIATPHPFHAENATLCLEAGVTESDLMPLDRIRATWGLRYPGKGDIS